MNNIHLISNKSLATFFISIFLASMIFSSSGTFITSFYNGTIQYLGDSEDTLIISSNISATIATSHIPFWLITPLSKINGVESVSPETIAVCSSDSHSFFVRGIFPSEFFKNQYIHIIQGRNLRDNDTFSILLGDRLANRLGKSVGDAIFLFSALVNDYAKLKIIGIFKSGTLLDDEGIIPLSIGSMLSDTYPAYVNLIRIKYDPSIVTSTHLIDAVFKKRTLTIHVINGTQNINNAEVTLLRYDFERMYNSKWTNDTGYVLFSNLLLNTYFIKIKIGSFQYLYQVTPTSDMEFNINLNHYDSPINETLAIHTISDHINIANIRVFILGANSHRILFSGYTDDNGSLAAQITYSPIKLIISDNLNILNYSLENVNGSLWIDLHRSSSVYYKIPSNYFPYTPSHLKMAIPTGLIRSSLKQMIGVTENILWSILLVVAVLSLFLIRIITNTFFSEIRRNISVIRAIGARFSQAISYVLPLQLLSTIFASALGYLTGFASIGILVHFDLLLVGGHSYFPIFSPLILIFAILIPLSFSLPTTIFQIHFVYSHPLAQVLNIRLKELFDTSVETDSK